MKNYRTRNLTLLLLLFCFSNQLLFGNNKPVNETDSVGYNKKSPARRYPVYIQAEISSFFPKYENYSKYFGGPVIFHLSGRLGLPVSSKIFLICQVAYFNISSNAKWPVFVYNSDAPGYYQEMQEFDAHFMQLSINPGLMYSINLSTDYNLGISCGLTFSKIDNEFHDQKGNFISGEKGGGLSGYFLGAEVERYINNYFSLTGSFNYNFSFEIIKSLVNDRFDGMYISLGGRLYLKQR